MASSSERKTEIRKDLVQQHHIDCAEFSHVVYGSDELPKSFGTVFPVPVPNGELQRGFMNFEDSKVSTVCFEGTRVAGAWATNINFQPQKLLTLCRSHRSDPSEAKKEAALMLESLFVDIGKAKNPDHLLVHAGFFNTMFNAVEGILWSAFQTWLRTGSTRKRLYVTGHSQGAALATLFASCALGAVSREKLEVILITFGSPRIFSPEAARIVSSNLHPDSIRFVMVGQDTMIYDPVTQVPLERFNYDHVGSEVLLLYKSKMTEHFSSLLFDKNDKSLKDLLPTSALLGLHSMETYKSSLGSIGQPLGVEIKGGFMDAMMLLATSANVLSELNLKKVQEQFLQIDNLLSNSDFEGARKKAVDIPWLAPFIDHVISKDLSPEVCRHKLLVAKNHAVEALKTLRTVATLGVVAVQAINAAGLITELKKLGEAAVANQRELDAIRVELLTGDQRNKIVSCDMATTCVIKIYKRSPEDPSIPRRVADIRNRVNACLLRLDKLEININGNIRALSQLQADAVSLAMESARSALSFRTGMGALDIFAAIVHGIIAVGSAKIAISDSQELFATFNKQLQEVGELRAVAKEILSRLEEVGL